MKICTTIFMVAIVKVNFVISVGATLKLYWLKSELSTPIKENRC